MCVQQMWSGLRAIFAQPQNNRNRDADAVSRQQTRQTPLDPRRPATLRWLAKQLAAGRFSLDQLPQAQDIPQQFLLAELSQNHLTRQVQHWTRLLCLIRLRKSESCRLALAAALLADGMEPIHVRGAVQHVAPGIANKVSHSCSNPEYVDLELDHLESPTYELKLALAYTLDQHDAATAHEFAKEASELDSGRHEAPLCLANLHYNHGNFRESVAYYERAINAGCPDCREKWAEAANRAGMHQKALDIVKSTQFEKSPVLMLERARALAALNFESDDGLQSYKALDLNLLSNRAEVEAEIAELEYRFGRPGEAVRWTRSGVRQKEPRAMFVAGASSYMLRMWRDCVNVLSQFTQTFPDHPRVGYAWWCLGHSQFILGNHSQAVISLQAALRLDPHNRSVASVLGQALVRARRWDEVIDLCYNLPSPENHFGFDILPFSDTVSLLIARGQLADASALLARWVEARPREVMAWVKMGELAERLGRLQDALDAYRQAYSLNPGLVSIRKRIALLQDTIEAAESEVTVGVQH